MQCRQAQLYCVPTACSSVQQKKKDTDVFIKYLSALILYEGARLKLIVLVCS